MAKLVTNAIRDKHGKLLATYETASGAGDMPDDIAIKFGGVTPEQLSVLKQNPNYHGVPISNAYTVDTIMSVDPGDYYKTETARYEQDKIDYEKKYSDLQKEAQTRRTVEAQRIEAANAKREATAAEVHAKNKMLAHTTGNPFVAPGAREISRRKAKSAIDSFNSNQFELSDAIDSHNFLTFQGAFDTYDRERELAKYNANHGLNTYGGYDNKHNDYSTQKLFTKKEEEPTKTEAELNREKYEAIRPSYAETWTGLKLITEGVNPTKLTRAQEERQNKQAQQIQIGSIIDNKILDKIKDPDLKQAKKKEILDFINSPKVENSIIPSAYAETQTTQRVSFGAGGIDKIKEAVAQAKVIGPVTLSYVDADKKEQRVTVKNANEAVRKIYKETKNGSREFSISATSQPVQGPIQQIQAPNNEIGFGVAGNLTSIFGKEPQQQGPNINDKAFFVGANAQGYTIDTKREIEPRPTFTDVFGNNWYATKLDAIYELNKPIKERSDKPRPGPLGFSNREIGEFTAPFYNRAADVYDLFTKEKELDKPLGNPFAKVVTVNPTPRIETTLDKIIQGKPVDLTDKNQRISLYGTTLSIAGELYALDKGVGGAAKAQTAVSNVVKATKAEKAAQLTSEGKIFGTTKLDDNTFIITRGTEGGSLKVSEKVNPSLIIDRMQNKVTSFFTKTPKEVNTLSSGEKIQKSISEIDDKIAKLKPFTDSTRFEDQLVQKTSRQISDLEKQKAKLNDRLAKSLFPGEAQYPVSIVEFGSPSPAFPKGNIFTEFGKATAIEKTPIGSKIIITGEVPRQNLIQLGLKQVDGLPSTEFGIAQKGNPFYIGTLTEKNVSKLAEAEKLGFIKSLATGKSAPLEAVLKKQGDILGEYAGVTRATTKISSKNDEGIIDYVYHGTSKSNANRILKSGLGSNIEDWLLKVKGDFVTDDIRYASMYSERAASTIKNERIVEFGITKDAKIADLETLSKRMGVNTIEGKYQADNLRRVAAKAKAEGYDALILTDIETIVFNTSILKPLRVIKISHSKGADLSLTGAYRQQNYHSQIITDKKLPSIISRENNPIINAFKQNKVIPEPKPVITQSIDAPSKGFGAAESFGIVDNTVLPRGVTGIGSKGLDRLLPDVGLSTAKGTGKYTNKPFDFGNIGTSKGTGGSTGKAKSITVDEAKTAATNYLSTRPQAAPQDILFSAPRFLPPQYHGQITDNVLAFPQGTPEKFKNQLRIDSGLELNYKLKTGQSDGGDYFNRFGFELVRQTKKEFEKQETIPINIQARKPDQRIKVTPIQGLGLTPIQTPRTNTDLIQTPGLKTDLITKLTTTTITTDVPIKVPPRTPPPFEFGGFGFGFPGFGGGYDGRPRRKKTKKKYIVSSIDPFTPGSIETAGVKQQQTSSSKKIYGSLDISLSKARKKNQPKGKRSKHSIPDPF